MAMTPLKAKLIQNSSEACFWISTPLIVKNIAMLFLPIKYVYRQNKVVKFLLWILLTSISWKALFSVVYCVWHQFFPPILFNFNYPNQFTYRPKLWMCCFDSFKKLPELRVSVQCLVHKFLGLLCTYYLQHEQKMIS